MKVRCIKTKYSEDIVTAKHFESCKNSKLEITYDKIYIVYGIFIYDKIVSYLIQDDYFKPFSYPANLFEIIDSQLPYEEWHFGRFEENAEYIYIMGSKEMVASRELVGSIVEHDREGLFHFEEWRKLIDRQYE